MNRGIFSIIYYAILLYLLMCGVSWMFTGWFNPMSLDVLTADGRAQFFFLYCFLQAVVVFVSEFHCDKKPWRLDLYYALFPDKKR